MNYVDLGMLISNIKTLAEDALAGDGTIMTPPVEIHHVVAVLLERALIDNHLKRILLEGPPKKSKSNVVAR